MQTRAQGGKEAGGGEMREIGGHLQFGLRLDSQLQLNTEILETLILTRVLMLGSGLGAGDFLSPPSATAMSSQVPEASPGKEVDD